MVGFDCWILELFMYLRSGAFLKSGARSIASESSKASTEGSVNQAHPSHLTAIPEDDSDSSSEQSYRIMSSLRPGVEVVNDTKTIGNVRPVEGEPKVLLYVTTNDYNAGIYQDRECDYYYLAGDTNLEILPEIIVRWHDDRFLDDQGRNFFRTTFPNEINPFGERQGALIDPEPNEEPPLVKEAEFRTTNKVVKVDMDQDEVGIYKYFDSRTSTAIYYK